MPSGGDRAGREFWDLTWTRGDLPRAVDPDDRSVWNHIQRRFHRIFRESLGGMPAGCRLLELGCARSPWLPYFAREFGFAVTGLDYSERGAAMARRVLENEGVSGEIVCADLFAPPERLLERFDAVTSFGVMEHFEDTAGALAAAARFLRPGGLLLTEIPNLAGILGKIQKAVNRPIYDIHVPLDREALAAAHQAAGLDVLRCDYEILTQFGLLNLGGLAGGMRKRIGERALWAMKIVSAGLWRLEELAALRPTRWSAGYIVAVARKSGSRAPA